MSDPNPQYKQINGTIPISHWLYLNSLRDGVETQSQVLARIIKERFEAPAFTISEYKVKNVTSSYLNKEIKINWTAINSIYKSVLGYNIYRSNGTIIDAYLGHVDSDKLYFLDLNVDVNTEYEYSVSAILADKTSISDITSITTPLSFPILLEALIVDKLSLWIDADATNSYTVDENNIVTNLEDLSPYELLVSVENNTSLELVNAVNNDKKGFDNSNAKLTLPNSLGLSAYQDLSLLLCFRPHTNRTTNQIIIGRGYDREYSISLRPNGDLILFSGNNVNYDVVHINSNLLGGEKYILEIYRDYNPDRIIKCFVNGSEITGIQISNNYDTRINTRVTSLWNGYTGSSLEATIYEMLFFDELLSDSNKLSTREYLAEKHNISF